MTTRSTTRAVTRSTTRGTTSSVSGGPYEPVAPAFTIQPTNVTADEGTNATFTSFASGYPAPTYQWEVNDGGGWDTLSGATNRILTLTAVTAAMDGYQYRNIATNDQGSATSSVVTLTVEVDIVFTINPSTATPVAGVDVTWSTNAGDLGTPVSYAWDFGDYTVPGTGATPAHFWTSAGPYTVSCTVVMDDNSTYTATQVISPTAPSATSGQTSVRWFDFDEAITAANAVAVYGVEGYAGADINVSRPVGAKLFAETGFGNHLSSHEFNWALYFQQSTTGARQCGAWYYLESAPASFIRTIMPGNYQQGPKISNDLSMVMSNLYDTPETALFAAGEIPLREWFWVGVAVSGTDFKVTLRKRDGNSWSDTTESFNYEAGFGTISAYWSCGVYSAEANRDHNTRFSGLTLHTMASLDDAGYPGEVVPPQIANYIYNVDPVNGDDANNGISAPWETLAKINTMLATYDHVVSKYTANSNGSGAHLVIDTSAGDFVIENTALALKTNGVWVKPAEGETFIRFKPYQVVDPGAWSATGGYDDIYECAYTEQVATTVFGDGICFAVVISLALLDAEEGGASFTDVAGGKLYIKTLGLTNPASDGIEYIHGRMRPQNAEDVVGYPVVSLAAASLRVTGVYTRYTAMHSNGCYAIGDSPGYSEGAFVEDYDCRFGDKHLVAFTQDAVNSTLILTGYVEQSWEKPYTSYMTTGSGNIHNYIQANCGVSRLGERSATGIRYDGSTGVGSAFCHGNYGVFAELNFIGCEFDGSLVVEPIPLLITIDADCIMPYISTNVAPTTITGASLSELTDCYALDADGVQIVASVGNSVITGIGGSFINGLVDLRGFPSWGAGVALWTIEAPLTFTGNTVYPISALAQPAAMWKDAASADIVSCDYNTYYGLGPSDIIAINFNDGSTTADRTVTEWIALGYDTHSTFNP